jgi:hypothetical protein
MAVRLSVLRSGRPLPPGTFLVLISVRGWPQTQGHSEAGTIRSVEKSNDLIGNRTRDLPTRSIVSQSTTLPHPPLYISCFVMLPYHSVLSQWIWPTGQTNGLETIWESCCPRLEPVFSFLSHSTLVTSTLLSIRLQCGLCSDLSCAKDSEMLWNDLFLLLWVFQGITCYCT